MRVQPSSCVRSLSSACSFPVALIRRCFFLQKHTNTTSKVVDTGRPTLSSFSVHAMDETCRVRISFSARSSPRQRSTPVMFTRSVTWYDSVGLTFPKAVEGNSVRTFVSIFCQCQRCNLESRVWWLSRRYCTCGSCGCNVQSSWKSQISHTQSTLGL